MKLVRQADQLQISVSDPGVGFDPAQLPGAGDQPSGLGLLSIRERLDLLGGDMKIVSKPGEGTTITLTAPVAAKPTAQVVKESLAKISVGVTSAASGMMARAPGVTRVMLVDDHLVLRKVWHTCFESIRIWK